MEAQRFYTPVAGVVALFFSLLLGGCQKSTMVNTSSSTTPASPNTPTSPTAPTNPTTPTGPTSPTAPIDPTSPTSPTNPTSPSSPSSPTTPTSPSSPSAPAGTGTNYYVSTTGNDSTGDGTITKPWATIATASTHVKPGATVHVAAGLYTGSFDTYAAGTATSYITYEADTANFSAPVPCAQVAADQGNLTTCVRLVGVDDTDTWDNYGDYVAIEGFDISGPGMNGVYTQGNATLISGNHVHNVLPNTCNNDGGSGINLNGTNAEVVGNYVHNIGPFPSACGWVQGIYFLQAGGYAYNNITFANSGYGIQLWHYPENIAVFNNTVFNNASGGIVLGTDDDFTVDYISVANNIVVNNGGPGISEQGASNSSTGTHNTYLNNLLESNSGGAFALQNGLSAKGTVTASPQFVDYTGTTTGNYHLLSTSPALNAGTSSGAPSTDFDGNPRPKTGSVDIGAYQHVAAN